MYLKKTEKAILREQKISYIAAKCIKENYMEWNLLLIKIKELLKAALKKITHLKEKTKLNEKKQLILIEERKNKEKKNNYKENLNFNINC